MFGRSRNTGPTPHRHWQGGFTLIEMVLFIVIVGVSLAGLVSILANAMKGSVDAVSQKQALSIAEAVLEEISQKPFTWCDPDDPMAATASGTASCTTPLQDHEGTTRSSFDNVIDYSRIPSIASPISDQSGTYTFPAGFQVSGTHPGLDLVEILELREHPFFIGVQFHPEFQSKPFSPHPLFAGFIKAASAGAGA